MADQPDHADAPHPLRDHAAPLAAAIANAVDAAAGSAYVPSTLAEFDQHEKACADVEALVRDILDAEREAGALAYLEAMKW